MIVTQLINWYLYILLVYFVYGLSILIVFLEYFSLSVLNIHKINYLFIILIVSDFVYNGYLIS